MVFEPNQTIQAYSLSLYLSYQASESSRTSHQPSLKLTYSASMPFYFFYRYHMEIGMFPRGIAYINYTKVV